LIQKLYLDLKKNKKGGKKIEKRLCFPNLSSRPSLIPGPLPRAGPTGSFPPLLFRAAQPLACALPPACPQPAPCPLPRGPISAHGPLPSNPSARCPAAALARAAQHRRLRALSLSALWPSRRGPPRPRTTAHSPGPGVCVLAQPTVLLPHRNNRPFGAHVVHPRSCKSLAQLPSLMPPLSEPSPRTSLPRPPLAIGALPRLARRPPEAVSPMSFVSTRPW
jgi:hypothetical protein